MPKTALTRVTLFTLLPLAMLVQNAVVHAAAAADTITASATLDTGRPGPVIDRNVYGHFVEHLGRGVYEGIWVGEASPIPNTRGIRNDVVAALKKLSVPVVRWPGGCFADNYHWRDGIGAPKLRPASINSSWGNVPETNAFGTHEFMDFLDQLGAKAYLSVNVGSGTPQEQQAWLEYMTAPADTAPGRERAANGHAQPWQLPFIGVGNESWGCGGNMLADHYADQFRLYSAYLRTRSGERARLIASGADTDDYDWTDTVMARAMNWRPKLTPLMYNDARPLMSGVSLHFYTFATNDWHDKGSATRFDENAWISTLARASMMDELIRRHGAVMDKYDPARKVALVVDEWGTWFNPDKGTPSQLYQQNTLREAIVAGLTLNIFHHHADRVRMANIAQMVNVLQAMVLTDRERMLLTPTYHVFDMYQVHQDAVSLPLELVSPGYTHDGKTLPALSMSASRDGGGKVHLSIVNIDPQRGARLTVNVGAAWTGATGQVLTAPQINTFNSFDQPHQVEPTALTKLALSHGMLTLELPSKSVSVIELH